MNKNDQEFLVQKIRTQYTEKESNEIDALRALDARVKRPANVFAYTFGSLSAIVMGAGMSLVMTDIGSALGAYRAFAMPLGILIGTLGILAVAAAYPIYNRITKQERERVAPEILRLTDELMK